MSQPFTYRLSPSSHTESSRAFSPEAPSPPRSSDGFGLDLGVGDGTHNGSEGGSVFEDGGRPFSPEAPSPPRSQAGLGLDLGVGNGAHNGSERGSVVVDHGGDEYGIDDGLGLDLGVGNGAHNGSEGGSVVDHGGDEYGIADGTWNSNALTRPGKFAGRCPISVSSGSLSPRRTFSPSSEVEFVRLGSTHRTPKTEPQSDGALEYGEGDEDAPHGALLMHQTWPDPS
ncbi:hypothetical protein PsYK624_165080 [Phanerochaete sordida]|uniref:Uncharacterized protein n=1 Tax=Phanerochaete sordida TaxID=48140 RepID=A0A9P3LNM4_9APHY|nr:hypothetical protein PsYK624_165080 [Phanerochaete sordida]